MPGKYILEWDAKDWCCAGDTIRECVNNTLDWHTTQTEADIKFLIKHGSITVSKISKPLSFKTFVEHLKPKARCINPIKESV